MANASSTPPPLHAQPTAKERKYDRQLRLWAASGQAALETAHILLINSGTGVVGSEALKNLVLPGIGQFTIQDSTQVTEADLGVNFFLEEGDLGKLRAERTKECLLELNPDVRGHAVSEVNTAALLRLSEPILKHSAAYRDLSLQIERLEGIYFHPCRSSTRHGRRTTTS